MRYLVQWHEQVSGAGHVDATDEAEALEKARRGEWVEGTQGSGPVGRGPRAFNVLMRVPEVPPPTTPGPT